MTHEELAADLRAKGIECRVVTKGVGLANARATPVHIVCAENAAYQGVSFWIQISDAGDFIGLWSPRFYRLNDRSRLMEVIAAMFSGEYVPLGQHPTVLPESMIQKFDLVEVDDIEET